MDCRDQPPELTTASAPEEDLCRRSPFAAFVILGYTPWAERREQEPADQSPGADRQRQPDGEEPGRDPGDAASLLEADGRGIRPASLTLVHVVAWTVLASIFLHGLSAGPIGALYGRRMARAPTGAWELGEADEPQLRHRPMTPVRAAAGA